MDPFRNPPPDSLAAARLHVQALTECGLPREALLRALLENYSPSEGDSAMNLDATFPPSHQLAQQPHPQQPQQQQPQQQQQQPQTPQQPAMQAKTSQAYNARLSVSTTSSRSSGRASVLSTATSLSSVSSVPSSRDMAPFPPPPPPSATSSAAPSTKSSNRGTSKPQGAYWCTFCDVAFQRKFDWKRHEDEFHERYKRYPCPNCNRIFWGANTFNQHHKNAHGCTTCPHADRVVQYTRRKQAWACGFCGGFLASRDRYFDHVARHYEDGCTKMHWNHSLVIYGLLHQPYITHAWKELYPSLYGHLPREQQPVLEWDPKLTGHAQGFLEGESPGKLQDLLEFFNESTDDPRFLANLALSSAIVRPRTTATSSMVSELPGTPVSRRISEPPKSTAKMPVATSKHMSAPQPAGAFQQFDSHALMKQRSMAAPSAFSSSQMLHSRSQAQQPQPQQHPQALEQHQQHHQLHPSNPFMSSFPQAIMEAPEQEHPFFMTQSSASHMQAHQAHQAQLSQHALHRPQQPPQHQLTIPTIPETLFEDWSSLTTTVVDEAAFSIAEGWETASLDLRSPSLGTGTPGG
ncbi:hypothetical protein QBC47DRAFT_136546 [Echria macrotheca]|uniref:C2H2-type domain-containing protein n=1 Tax=Echria macrotheca TaxID=438768 RepID=A0AAJ0BJH7_9PEZI|nr:hypothetical protein QBC47DRAFT_136546 [Echria macrotheca]